MGRLVASTMGGNGIRGQKGPLKNNAINAGRLANRRYENRHRPVVDLAFVLQLLCFGCERQTPHSSTAASFFLPPFVSRPRRVHHVGRESRSEDGPHYRVR